MNIFTFTYNTILVDEVTVMIYTNNYILKPEDAFYEIDYMTDDTFYIGKVWNTQTYEKL